jgi:FKBP-type peptidyl-prolyl cis-trans isomerase
MNLGIFPHIRFRSQMIAHSCALTFVWSALALGTFAVAVEPQNPAPAQNHALPLSGFAGVGSSFAQSSRLNELGWTEEQIQAFVDGVRAALHGKAYPFDEAARQVSGEMGRRVHELDEQSKTKISEYSQPGKLDQYMKEARKRLRLQQTPSGLGYRIEPGRGGVRPRPDDAVVFSCIAHTADGVTDIPQLSSQNIRAKMKDLVPGLLEGLQMMTLDSKAFLVIPPALLFGDSEWPAGMERGAPIQVQLTLHEVIPPTP